MIGQKGSLAGLRVLDLTQALAGPFCTQMLADHGADVVKVESPVGGDLARRAGPFHPDDVTQRDAGYFHSINRNKRSIIVDLKKEAGRNLIMRLVPKFDVVVENFRTGVMDRLGLSFEAMQERNPRLVYAAIRGFGDPRTGTSPYVDWPAYDVVAQAMGGMTGVTGIDRDHPVKIGPGVGDTVPALYLAFGILAAVLRARETGQGQFVDVSMVDAILAISERIVYQKSFGGVVAGIEGNHHPFIAPFGVFRSKDGHVAVACPDDHFFSALCRALDAEDLLLDATLDSMSSRRERRDALIDLIGQRVATFTNEELKARLGGLVPFGPVYTSSDISSDEHFAARQMLPEIACEGIQDKLQIAGTPVKFSETPGGVFRRGPRHGEHTREVLREAGLECDEIEDYYSVGALG